MRCLVPVTVIAIVAVDECVEETTAICADFWLRKVMTMVCLGYW